MSKKKCLYSGCVNFSLTATNFCTVACNCDHHDSVETCTYACCNKTESRGQGDDHEQS